MKDYWNLLNNMLSDTSEQLTKNINSPATDKEIKALEAKLKISFPEGLKSFYKIHNGQKAQTHGILPSGVLLSLEEIWKQYSIWSKLVNSGTFDNRTSEPETRIKNDWYNLKRIPITHDGSGNRLCLDLDPSEEGIYGQIITMEHETPDRDIVAESLEKWIEKVIHEFQNGKYRFDEAYGIFELNK